MVAVEKQPFHIVKGLGTLFANIRISFKTAQRIRTKPLVEFVKRVAKWNHHHFVCKLT